MAFVNRIDTKRKSLFQTDSRPSKKKNCCGRICTLQFIGKISSDYSVSVLESKYINFARPRAIR